MLHWGIFSPHHILAFSAWHSEPPCLLSCDVQSRLSRFDIHSYCISLAFRAVPSSHHRSQYSEPPSLFSLAFRATIIFSLTFRVVLLTVWRSKPPSLLRLAFKATFFSLAFRATISLQLGIQSHHPLFSSTFRAIMSLLCLMFRVIFSVQHSKPHLQFGIQSRIFLLAFRVASSVWRSESLFGFSSEFRVIIPSSFWCSKSLFVSSSTFKLIMSSFRSTFRVASSSRHSEPHL